MVFLATYFYMVNPKLYHMKKLSSNLNHWLVALLLMLVALPACEKEDIFENPKEEDPGQNTPIEADPNKATASLIFDNMKTLSGTPPLTGAITEDLKIDTDTIFWTESIAKRIMVKRPEDISLSGVWILVAGSSSYIEATFREDEDTEEIDILYFDFDPTGWDLPVSFPVNITPFDDDGNALDQFEVPVVIEKPYEASSGCAFDYAPDRDATGGTFWDWVFTEDKANKFFAAPMYPFITDGTTMGCCENGQSSQDPNCPESGRTELHYENYYTISREMFKLNVNGFIGFSTEVTRNFDPGESDFCGSKAGYIYDDKYSVFGGDWQINEECHLIFDYEVREPFVYVGSIFKPLSRHYIEEVRGAGPDGGGAIRRVYVMRKAIEGGGLGPWYD